MKPKLNLRHLFVLIFSFSSFLSFSSSNDGSINKPYTVLEAIQLQDSGNCWVQGYIAGCVKTSGGSITSTYVKTNLALGSDPAGTAHVSIQLPNNVVRTDLNLIDHPENRGKRVLLYGSLKKYCGIAGITNTSNYQIVTSPHIIATPSPLKLTKNVPVKFYVTGVNLTDSIVLSSGTSTVIPSKLPPGASNAEVIVLCGLAGNSFITLESDSIYEQVETICIPQSNDASLQSLKIGSETIKLTSSFVYNAKPVSFETLSVPVLPVVNHPRASIYKIIGNQHLTIGENNISIWVQAEDGTNQVYNIHLTRKCDPPTLVQQPNSMISVCNGSNYTLETKTLGNGLSYQWFFQGDSIPEATEQTLKLYGVSPEKEYGYYFVKIKGACGNLMSNPARLWIADSLPATLRLEAPDTICSGNHYKVAVGYEYGYNDVTNYTWSFSKNNIHFDSGIENNSPITYFATDENSTSGTLKVELSHVCGKRSVSKSLKLVNPTGIEDLEISQIRIYPNPVINELFIDNGTITIDKIRISNMKGQVVYSENPGSYQLKLPIAIWSAGIYIVTIYSERGVNEYKILKK